MSFNWHRMPAMNRPEGIFLSKAQTAMPMPKGEQIIPTDKRIGSLPAVICGVTGKIIGAVQKIGGKGEDATVAA